MKGEQVEPHVDPQPREPVTEQPDPELAGVQLERVTDDEPAVLRELPEHTRG